MILYFRNLSQTLALLPKLAVLVLSFFDKNEKNVSGHVLFYYLFALTRHLITK